MTEKVPRCDRCTAGYEDNRGSSTTLSVGASESPVHCIYG